MSKKDKQNQDANKSSKKHGQRKHYHIGDDFYDDKKLFSDAAKLLRDNGFDPEQFLSGLFLDQGATPPMSEDSEFFRDEEMVNDEDALDEDERELGERFLEDLRRSHAKREELRALKRFLTSCDPKREKSYVIGIAVDICKEYAHHRQACLEAIVEYSRGYMRNPRFQLANWKIGEEHPTVVAMEELIFFSHFAGQPRLKEKYFQELQKLDPDYRIHPPTILACSFMVQKNYAKARELILDFWNDWYAKDMFMHYNRAILTYLLEGPTDQAVTYLNDAYNFFPHIAKAIVLNVDPHDWSEEELRENGCVDEDAEQTRIYLMQYLLLWREKPGTIAWVRETLGITPQDPQEHQEYKKSHGKRLLSRAEDWPQRENTDIFIDAIKSNEHGWLLVIVAFEEDEDNAPNFQHVQPFERKPKPVEMLGELMDFMSRWSDEEGYPGMKPTRVIVSQKQLVTAWKKRLDKLGVSCVMASQDQLEILSGLADLVRGLDTYEKNKVKGGSYEDLRWLEKNPGVCWEILAQKMPTWVEEKGKFLRLWNAVVVDTDSEMILGNDTKAGEITPEELAQMLINSAISPMFLASPALPSEIRVCDPNLHQIIEKPFGKLGVNVTLVDHLEQACKILEDIAKAISQENDGVPSLMSIPGVTESHFDDFYQAADLYYRAKPWQHLDDFHPVRVDYQADSSGKKETYYVVAMGNGGLTFGLAFYFSRKDLTDLLDGQWRGAMPPQPGESMSVLYSENFEIPVSEIDMIEEKKYPIENSEAYPLFLRIRPGGAIQVPLLHEMEKMTACLNGVVKLVEQRLKPTTVAVNLTGGKHHLSLAVEPMR